MSDINNREDDNEISTFKNIGVRFKKSYKRLNKSKIILYLISGSIVAFQSCIYFPSPGPYYGGSFKLANGQNNSAKTDAVRGGFGGIGRLVGFHGG